MLYNVKTLIRLQDPKNQLKLEKVNQSKSGTAYTFLQVFDQIEVYGCTVTVSVNNDGVTTSLHSTIMKNNILEGVSVNPILSIDECFYIVQDEYPDIVLYSDENNEIP